MLKNKKLVGRGAASGKVKVRRNPSSQSRREESAAAAKRKYSSASELGIFDQLTPGGPDDEEAKANIRQLVFDSLRPKTLAEERTAEKFAVLLWNNRNLFHLERIFPS